MFDSEGGSSPPESQILSPFYPEMPNFYFGGWSVDHLLAANCDLTNKTWCSASRCVNRPPSQAVAMKSVRDPKKPTFRLDDPSFVARRRVPSKQFV